MKAFLKQVLVKTVTNLFALILTAVVCLLLYAFFIVFLQTKAEEARLNSIPSKTVLVLNFSQRLLEAPQEGSLEAWLQGQMPGLSGTLQLRSSIEAIERAGNDERVQAIVLTGRLDPSNGASGWATIHELRNALERFQKSGKPIIAWLIDPSQRDYYLASVANEIWMHPQGMLMLQGFSSQQLYMAEALERNGIGIQVVRTGRYKSAIEPFIRNDMSEAAREQAEAWIGQRWQLLLTTLSHARGMPTEALEALAAQAFIEPQTALEAELLDQIGYHDEFIARMIKEFGEASEGDSFEQTTFGHYLHNPLPVRGLEKQPHLAIVYIEGAIFDQAVPGGGAVAADLVSKRLRKLRQDENVAGVLLRVNSPGGSALGSDLIGREIKLLSEVKPVAVSMSNVAASGGYWVSANADRIFVDPFTVTGSIGVFGLLPNFEPIAKEYGLHFDGVETAPMAGLFSPTRPRTEAELARIQAWIDSLYEKFLVLVSRGRGLSPETVEALAGGRVWSGPDAKRYGLADEIGGMAETAHWLRGKLEQPDLPLLDYPRPLDFWRSLGSSLGIDQRNLSKAELQNRLLQNALPSPLQSIRSWLPHLQGEARPIARLPWFEVQ